MTKEELRMPKSPYCWYGDTRELWAKLFDFHVGDILEHSMYPKHRWRVVKVNSDWISLERLTPQTSRIVPFRIDVHRNIPETYPKHLRKIA